LNPVLAQVLAEDPYDQLPDSIKLTYTREQWLWFSDAEKAGLVQRETECEYDG